MEIVDIVNSEGVVIGTSERKEAHKKFLLHKLVHIYLSNDKGEILFNLRSRKKSGSPLKWMASAGGHVESGENPDITAHKELKEELGVEAELEYIGNVFSENEAHLIYIYYGRHDGPFTIDENEMEKIEWFSVEKIKKEMKNPDFEMTPGSLMSAPLLFANKNL